MPSLAEIKRQNFNVTPEEEAELLALKSELATSSVKVAIFAAVRLTRFLAHELRNGRRIGLKDRKGNITDVILPEIQGTSLTSWTYLVERPHSWKKQLFVKGRKLSAAQVWLDIQANNMTPGEAAVNWELPEEAISEITEYCESNVPLLKMEADEEKLFLTSQGIKLSA